MILVYLVRQSKAVFYVTPEAVYLYRIMTRYSVFFSFPVPSSVALHQNEFCEYVTGGAAADWSQGSHSDSYDTFI